MRRLWACEYPQAHSSLTSYVQTSFLRTYIHTGWTDLRPNEESMTFQTCSLKTPPARSSAGGAPLKSEPWGSVWFGGMTTCLRSDLNTV